MTPLLLVTALALGACLSVRGQQLNIGVVAGTNLTDDVRSGSETYPGGLLPSGDTSFSTFIVHPGERRPILGLRFEVDLGRGWAVAADALHREWKSTTQIVVSPPWPAPGGGSSPNFGTYTRTLTTWEFPILARRRFRIGGLHPLFGIGPAFRPAGSGTGLSHVGAAGEAGVEFQAGGLRILPELRYTRWAAKPVGYIVGSPRRNQVEFLVAVERQSAGSPLAMFGRRLSVGVLAGIGLGRDFRVGDFNPTQLSERNSGIAGVSIEAALTDRWGVEVDGLYRPLHGTDAEANRRIRFAHLTWEFPVLAKHRIRGVGRVTPFLAAGPSFRAEGNLNLQSVSHVGATAGAGVETKWRFVKIAPSFRYTYWGSNGSPAISRTDPNEAQLLISFAF